MDKALNRKLSGIVSVLVCIALALSVFAAIGAALFANAAEHEEEYTQYQDEPLTVSNNQFSSSSGSFPKTPDSWTGSGVEGSGSSNIISGVMNLDSYAENKDNYKLSHYYPDEFSGNTSPESPFGQDTKYSGTNRDVLFINSHPSSSEHTQSAGTAYGYTSNSLTLTANRYYRITAWVRTGNFKNGGAAIRINGLDDDVAFNNINTVANGKTDKDNDYGWEKYTFYIASSSYGDQTATISLQVGDRYSSDKDVYYYPAVGYAFFDNIEAYQISPANFLDAKAIHVASADDEDADMNSAKIRSGNTLIVDYSNRTTAEKFDSVQNLSFTDGLNGWTYTGTTDLRNSFIGTYNGYAPYTKDENDSYQFSADPASSYGRYSEDSEILVVSSYTDGMFHTVATGVASSKFKIERYRYYRISAWVKSQEISGDGSGATLALSVIRNPRDDEYEGQNIFAKIENCSGDSENKPRAGFSQYSFYVKGSATKDFEASIECWLGTPENESSGIALFDNITIEEITPALYTAHSGSGTAVDIDTAAGADNSTYPTYADTGITNGEFVSIDSYTEFAYPFAPANWTRITPETSATTGYSADMSYIDTDDIISGIIPTDDETYYANDNYKNFGSGAINPVHDEGSVLMLYSKKLSAFGYRSSNFTVTADTPGELTVSLWSDLEGYGASLILKNNTSVLATIEGIKDTDGFKTYTFYIEPDSEDISTLCVEIWLGNADRKNNFSRRAAGHLYVQRVAYQDIASDENGDSAATKFARYKSAYDTAKTTGASIGQAAYSFKTIDLGAYDYYDKSYVKYSYDWSLAVNAGESNTVKYGIFDSKNRTEGNAEIPDKFTDDGKNNILVLHNAAPAASTLSYNGSIALSADAYYKVEVSLRVNIPEQEDSAVGATISLSGTKHAFKDIKSTVRTSGNEIIDNQTFRTYTFYINTGSEAQSISLDISLGDASSRAKWCSGYVYVNSITYTDITNVAYEEAEKNIKDDDNDFAKYALAVALGEETEEDNNTPSEPSSSTLDWWLIPSILFAVAILIAIVGFSVRKIMEKRAAKKGTVVGQASYDRTATLNRAHNEKADESEKVASVASESEKDANYDKFDEDAAPVAESKAQAEETVKSEENDKVEATESETAEANESAQTENTETTEEAEKAEASEESHEETGKSEEQPPAEESASEEIAPASDAFLDQFDD